MRRIVADPDRMLALAARLRAAAGGLWEMGYRLDKAVAVAEWEGTMRGRMQDLAMAAVREADRLARRLEVMAGFVEHRARAFAAADADGAGALAATGDFYFGCGPRLPFLDPLLPDPEPVRDCLDLGLIQGGLRRDEYLPAAVAGLNVVAGTVQVAEAGMLGYSILAAAATLSGVGVVVVAAAGLAAAGLLLAHGVGEVLEGISRLTGWGARKHPGGSVAYLNPTRRAYRWILGKIGLRPEAADLAYGAVGLTAGLTAGFGVATRLHQVTARAAVRQAGRVAADLADAAARQMAADIARAEAARVPIPNPRPPVRKVKLRKMQKRAAARRNQVRHRAERQAYEQLYPELREQYYQEVLPQIQERMVIAKPHLHLPGKEAVDRADQVVDAVDLATSAGEYAAGRQKRSGGQERR